MLCAADTVHLAAGLRRFSTKLWPLESEDEIVALLLGMARYPVDTPDRAELIAADMQTKHASTTINVLVSSIESEAGISALVDLLDRKRFHEQEKSTPLHLVPQIEFCAVCALQGQKVCLVVSDEPVRPTVYCTHGRFDGLLYCKRCPDCRAKHNLSYAEESTRLAQGKQVPYDGAMDRTRKYVQLSRDIIFEGEMLWRLDTQMLHSHTGFEPYAKEWTTFADEPPQLVEPLRIALSHAWLAWTLLRWRDELQLPKEPLSFASPTHLDETLLDYTMRRDPKTGRFDADSLIVRFTDKWGREHELVCLEPKDGSPTCLCYIIDGHMKCRRLICENRRFEP